MVFNLEMKNNRAKAFGWFLVLGILTGLLMAFFPLLQDDNLLSLANGFRDGFSENMQPILGFGREVAFDKFTDYVPFIFQYLGILFAIFAIQLGAKSLSREQSAGTIEYLYSNPITRTEIYSGKFSADMLHYGLVLLFVLVVAFLSAYVFGVHDIRNLALVILQIFICLLLLGFEFLCIGFFYSAISSRASHAEGGSLLLFIAIALVWAALTFMGNSMEPIAAFFPFTALNPLNMVGGTDFQWIGIVANILLGLIFWILGCIVYKGKELKF
ncbi:MAG: ABC transporter permease subunit [Peptoniphilus sp.]|nr:ABC transporter permease subunit [Peptoniphilus sp.]MDY3119236.1 ABC transporter permease subunit [Peptoniphilus sp.]